MRRGHGESSLEIHIRECIQSRLLPHIGTEEVHNRRKAHFITSMAKRLMINYLYDMDEDDRDHIGKKRLDLVGDLMMQLFVSAFKNEFLKNAKTII